jgi:hypothetical protein
LLNPAQQQRAITLTSQAFMIVNVGAIGGYLTLMWAMNAVGRRWCYFLVCIGSLSCTVALFTLIHTLDALFGFLVIWGFLRHRRGLSSRAFSDKVSRYGARVLLELISARHGVWTIALGLTGQRIGSRRQIGNGDCRDLFHRDGCDLVWTGD